MNLYILKNTCEITVILMHIITVISIFYTKIGKVSLNDWNMWCRRTTKVFGTVEEVLFSRVNSKNSIFLAPSVILLVSYKSIDDKNIIKTYICDKDLQYRPWKKGDNILLKVLNSDQRQCHLEKFSDEKPTRLFKIICVIIMTIILTIMNFVYVVMMDRVILYSSMLNFRDVMFLITLSCMCFFPSIVIINIMVEIIRSEIEKYQCNYYKIVKNLEDKK